MIMRLPFFPVSERSPPRHAAGAPFFLFPRAKFRVLERLFHLGHGTFHCVSALPPPKLVPSPPFTAPQSSNRTPLPF